MKYHLQKKTNHSLIALSIISMLSFVHLTSCTGNDPAKKDPQGANHYYISALPNRFLNKMKDFASRDYTTCSHCVFSQSVQERSDLKGYYHVEFGYTCEKHDVQIKTYYSSEKDTWAKLRFDSIFKEDNVDYLETLYQSYSSLVSTHISTLSELIDDKNLDVCYGNEITAYQLWYGERSHYDIRYSFNDDGTYIFYSYSEIKPTLLGAIM